MKFSVLFFLTAIACSAQAQSDGSLDLSYQYSGIDTFRLGPGFNALVDAAVQSPEKVIILGQTSTVTRLDTAGNIDTSFGNAGVVDITWSFPNRLAVSSGRIYVGGWTPGNDISVQCFHTNGLPDSTFGTNSRATYARPGSEIVYDMAVDARQRLLLAGRNAQSGNHDMLICRVLPSGGLDSSFGTNGYQLLAAGSSNDEIWSIGFQSDQKIIVAGESYQNGNKIAVARLDTSGNLDPGFGLNGYHFSDIINRQTYVDHHLVLPDDKILVTGRFDNTTHFNMYVARLSSSGTLDNSFASGGVFRTTASRGGNHLIRQSDDKILVAGMGNGGFVNKNDFQVWRLDTTGSADPTWSGNGYVQTDFDTDNDNPRFLWQIPSGKIIALGSARSNARVSFIGSARYHNSGQAACIPENQSSSIAVCLGDSALIHGNYETQAGTYRDTLRNTSGCDSISTVQLSVLRPDSSTQMVQTCQSFQWRGNTFLNSGVYYDTITGSQGCDSILKLNLTLNSASTATDVVKACDRYTWIDGNTYTSSNNKATDTLINAAGCDSVVSLNLTISNSTSGTDVVKACDRYTWIDGNTYTSSNNTATDTLTSAAGCDSVVSLDLTIQSVTDTSTSLSGSTITASNASATYQWLDCDDSYAVITGATSQSFTPTANGNYAVELRENGCIDTSACVSINSIGVAEWKGELIITAYPNPTKGAVHISSRQTLHDLELILTDLQGRALLRRKLDTLSEFVIELNGAPGLYLLHIKSSSGNHKLKLRKH